MYSYNYGIDEEILEFLEEFGFAFLGILLGIVLIVLVFGILTYVLRSVGLSSIAKRRGINHAWLAWIPVGNYWIAGSIADQYQYVAKGRIKNKRKIMLGLCIASVAVSLLSNIISSIITVILVDSYSSTLLSVNMAISTISSLVSAGVSIALVVFWYMAMYDLYSSCNPGNNVLFLVLSIIFNITEPFFIFCNRKKDDGMPPRRPEPQPYFPQQPQYGQPQYGAPQYGQTYQQPQYPQQPQDPWQNNQ